MANPYRALFDAPGTKRLAIAGFIARMPMAMTSLGIITMLAQLRGSYGLASAVAAVYVLAQALIAPQISRQADRHGQGKVLPVATGISVAGLLALLACTWIQAPDWTLFLCAVPAGFMPSMPAMIRARWVVIHSAPRQVRTAFALESVLDEACFMVGPVLAVGLSAALFPQAGPLLSAILLAIGVPAFAAQRGTEPPATGPASGAARHERGQSALRLPGVASLAVLMLGLGAIVGAVDVAAVAFAAQAGRPAAAGIVLAVYAVGACSAGLLFGAIQHELPLRRLLWLGGLLTALSTLPLLAAAGIFSLSLFMLAVGLVLSPTMIVGMTLAEKQLPASRVTEGLTWLLTGLNVGISLGAMVTGQVIDAHGVSAGFSVSLAAGALVFLCALHGSVNRA